MFEYAYGMKNCSILPETKKEYNKWDILVCVRGLFFASVAKRVINERS